jgi:hypothetical protein
VPWSALQDLSLSLNRLAGTIPPDLGALPLLKLDLSHNMLSGHIPLTLGNATSMLRLDLSGNHLDGGVPVELTKLAHMWHLNLSHNNLTGEVPALLGKMASLQDLDLSGNPGLCGDIAGLSSCHSDSIRGGSRSRRYRARLVLVVVTLVSAAALLPSVAAVSFVLLARRRRQAGQDSGPDTTASGAGGAMALTVSIWGKDAAFSFGDILAATEHFNEAYCIGKGSFGSVYRADLPGPGGRSLAVKRLDASETGDACWGVSEKNFENEVRALTRVRHHNIVRLHGFSAMGGHMYLAYELVERGSLGKVLYRPGRSCELFDWAARVRAIGGLAQALAYLHHDCSPPMIHRDVTVNNVLLDPDYEPRVSNFGTARFLAPGRFDCTSVAGSYGYMAPGNAKIDSGCVVSCAMDRCHCHAHIILTWPVLLLGCRAGVPEGDDQVRRVQLRRGDVGDPDGQAPGQPHKLHALAAPGHQWVVAAEGRPRSEARLPRRAGGRAGGVRVSGGPVVRAGGPRGPPNHAERRARSSRREGIWC